MFFSLSLLLAFVLPLCVFAAPIGSILKRQELVVRDQEADQGHNLTKRFDDTRWTFYNVETGNQVFCGGFHNNNDAIVALSGANMNQGLCGKTISMTFQGVTRTATIVDMCPGCPPFGLDLAQNFFTQFASSDMGVISGQWNFVDGGSPAPPPPPPPPPSPTPAPAPPPAPPAPDATPSPSPPDAPPASPTPSAAAPPPPEAPPASPTPSGAVPPPPEVPPPAPTTTPSDPSPAAAEPSSPPEPCEPDTPDAPADPASVSSPPNDPQPIPSPESPTPSPPPVSSSSSDLYPSSVSPAPEIPATTSTLTPTPIPTSSASSTDSASSSTSSDVSPTAVALGSIKTSGARSFLAGPKELTALVGALLVVFCCL